MEFKIKNPKFKKVPEQANLNVRINLKLNDRASDLIAGVNLKSKSQNCVTFTESEFD